MRLVVQKSIILTSFLFLLSFSLCGTLLASSEESHSSSFDSTNDSLLLLTASNFESTVLDSESSSLVLFYASWCSHCLQITPQIEYAAEGLKDWRPLVQIGALDCSSLENSQICRSYRVSQVPSLLFFPPHVSQKFIPIERTSSNYTFEALKEDILTFVQTHEDSYDSPPTLKSLNESETLFSYMRNQVPLILLYDKTSKSLLGKETVLARTLRLPVIRLEASKTLRDVLSFVGNESTIESFETQSVNDEDYLFVFYFNGQSLKRIPLYQNSSETSFLLENISKFVSKDNKLGKEEEKENTDIKRRRYSVYLSDLEKAVLISLRNEIGGQYIIQGRALKALENYLEALIRYFPIRHDTLLNLLKDLRSWTQNSPEGIFGKDISELFSKKESSEWKGCKGSQEYYGGYPCGLWSTFHVLTVNAAATDFINGPRHFRLNEEEEKEKKPETMNILTVVADYMEHFFTCKDCSAHFLSLVSSSAFFDEIYEYKGPLEPFDFHILWLWKAHNSVNLRLRGDVSDDALYPKRLFPSRDFCPECYKIRSDKEKGDYDVKEDDDDEDQFLPVNIVSFLIDLYKKDIIVTPSEHVIVSAIPKDHGYFSLTSQGFTRTHRFIMNHF